jgi:putative hemolysin
LLQLGDATLQTVGALAEPAAFVPETLTALELLEQFRARSNRMVFVVDEYGVVQGLVTPADLLEAITGELKPRAQVDAWAMRRDDGAWLLDGLMPIAELKARLGLADLPDEDKGRYNTLAGMLMAVMGRLPAVGDRVGVEGWSFEVEALEGRRAERVLARHAQLATTGPSTAKSGQ